MAIRLREVDGVLVAICAARSVERPGDVYLDDGWHHALSVKFDLDFASMGLSTAIYAESPEAQIMAREESNNPTRTWWDTQYGPSPAGSSQHGAALFCRATQGGLMGDERDRQDAEKSRDAGERRRDDAELFRRQAEAGRGIEETFRIRREDAREAAEQLRAEMERMRDTQERAREMAEATRGLTEQLRIASEDTRLAANDARQVLGELQALAANVRTMTARQETAVSDLEKRTKR